MPVKLLNQKPMVVSSFPLGTEHIWISSVINSTCLPGDRPVHLYIQISCKNFSLSSAYNSSEMPVPHRNLSKPGIWIVQAPGPHSLQQWGEAGTETRQPKGQAVARPVINNTQGSPFSPASERKSVVQLLGSWLGIPPLQNGFPMPSRNNDEFFSPSTSFFKVAALLFRCRSHRLVCNHIRCHCVWASQNLPVLIPAMVCMILHWSLFFLLLNVPFSHIE